MILLDTKAQTATSSSPLNLTTTEEKSTTSFSALLKGMALKSGEKVIQNGALVLSLEKNSDNIQVKDNSKSGNKDTLLSLLKSEASLSEKIIEPIVINPKITEKLSVKDVKSLITDAKVYLKDKILQSDEYKNAQVKDLPKTLKGLTELAQKIGIDVSKITIEEVQVKSLTKEVPKTLVKENIKQELNSQSEVKQSLKPEVQVKADIKQEVKPELQVKTTVKQDVKTEVKPELQVKTEVKQETKAELKPEVQVKADIKQEVKPEVQLKAEAKTELKQELKQQLTASLDNKNIDTQKELPSKTPLFQAQNVKEHTTEQLVSTKQFKTEEKTPATRADETLKLLLRGEKSMKNSSALTADFSVATARVIAPGATSEATKSLESLLRSDSSENVSKTDGLTTHKADSFEVKLNEAKQMIKYLSTDVKTAIEDYKSPFTRVKVQLNPQKLGEVDVTIVQRGKNLHVNISSNTTAINTLAANVNELRVQLSSNGINNASLNFNNSSQSEQQQQHSGQQNRQNGQEAREEYNYFENEETNEEILSSLEIVVPSYA